ncbi:hypothetical protein RFI_06787 [Reticulomyxa filosa]|uniref:Uncharacterized protein n=1 Tax=Reticulomyxa filosa TaxID=46433 RepID=X6NWH7_RETFI|nr:hypothetical protein RFI_06787 [Reticulomyxa filosa]|eukprot:ETO30331.1 hypothetical protein RFI_06787 [Reticulomyxa filosa]
MVVDYDGLHTEENKPSDIVLSVQAEIELHLEKKGSLNRQDSKKGKDKLEDISNAEKSQGSAAEDKPSSSPKHKVSVFIMEEKDESFWLNRTYSWIDGLAPQCIKNLTISTELYNSFFVRFFLQQTLFFFLYIIKRIALNHFVLLDTYFITSLQIRPVNSFAVFVIFFCAIESLPQLMLNIANSQLSNSFTTVGYVSAFFSVMMIAYHVFKIVYLVGFRNQDFKNFLL